jgi:signal transduction histidine kinase
LLDNAGRHTPSSAQITVSAQRQGDLFEWVVQDDGPGIQMGAEDDVFKKFYRVGHIKEEARASAINSSQSPTAGAGDARTRTQEITQTSTQTSTGTGTGLGLAICAAVAQLHGGSIRVTSAPGARFELSLPQPNASALNTASWNLETTFP